MSKCYIEMIHRDYMQASTTTAKGSAQQYSTDDDEEAEAEAIGANAIDGAMMNSSASASKQQAFNVDALAKRGKGKQTPSKKECFTLPKPSTAKKGKKVSKHRCGVTYIL